MTTDEMISLLTQSKGTKSAKPKEKAAKAKPKEKAAAKLKIRVRSPKQDSPVESVVSTPYRVSPSPETYAHCMHIFIDVREPEVYSNCMEIFLATQLVTEDLPCIESKALCIGDIEVCDASGAPMVIIERKTVADLIASIKDGRYTEQSYRLHHASRVHAHNIIYIIEGPLSASKYNSSTLKMVKSAILSLQLFKGFSVVRTNTVSETAGYIMELATRLARKFKEGHSLYFANRGKRKPNGEQEEKEKEEKEEKEGEEGEEEGEEEDGAMDGGSRGAIPSYSTVIKAMKKQNITYQNIHAIMLSQIPGISPHVAEILLDGRTMEEFIHRLRQGDRWLFQLKILLPRAKKARALSTSVIRSIYLYLFNTPPPPPLI